MRQLRVPVPPTAVQVFGVSEDEVTTYDVTGNPPLDAGAFHDTSTEPSATDAVTPVGAPGVVGIVLASEFSDALLEPDEFDA
jgi:hypothetical protein